MITYCAMLTAMAFVLDRFLTFYPTGMKIGVKFIPIVMSAILFGPVCGAIVGGLTDFLGSVLLPVGTPIPGLTVSAALIGLVYGLFLYKPNLCDERLAIHWKSIKFFPNVVITVMIDNIIFGQFINTMWLTLSGLYPELPVSVIFEKLNINTAEIAGSLFDSGKMQLYFALFLTRIPQHILMITLQLLIIPILLHIAKQLRKYTLKDKNAARRKT